MSRPYSWYPLATSDPVPGDPAVVRAGGDHYRQVATAIGDAERVLRALVDAQDAVSEAVDAIRDRTHAVADRIRRAHARYDAAGDALVRYSLQLDLAQTQSLDALHTAQSAQHSLDLAEDAVRRSRILLEDAIDLGEDTTTQQHALTTARSGRSDAEIDLARARLALAEAVERRDTAAPRAMDELDTGMDDTLHDGWWEDWGADVAQTVSTWAGNISAGLGVASLLLGWVPVLGQVLVVAALVTAGAALIADTALALKSGDGADWFNVGMGVLGFLSFGASRYLTKALDAFQVEASSVSALAQRLASRRLPGPTRAATSGPRPIGAPAERPSLATTADRTTPWRNQVRAAWDKVRALHGSDRVLALAGHGDVALTNNALQAQLLDSFPSRPLSAMVLVCPTIKGAALEAGAVVLYAGDVAMAYTSVSKAVVEAAIGPRPSPAARLGL
ncbi:putative T7SS-secreted protein [Cellulomonas xiejunii]|uniref:Putative T7SS secretion signal domain-containing protein n=1 Tax=Cellulomonas xiejunii TaxID=2968083 RepID=A0ABY5KT23_9CELL|nr:hypothetical protein [Cellulomonas xiejunii]MCC2314209.1 hypothetical protein [Cellulomonas xiejunii]MCC2319571.1 hypothetical protein [Cellulomonas xiejunii]UUI71483.1 hypothetical protein NP048_17085 [Cellulomonas xiejunii]